MTLFDKARRVAGAFVRHRRTLWGIPGLRVSYAFFIVYVGLGVAAIIQSHRLAGGLMAFAVVVEASDILPKDRRGRKLADWRKDLDIRSQWRGLLFIMALAAAGVPSETIVAFALFSLTVALMSRVMRSSKLHLRTASVLRPIGAMTSGVDELSKAHRVARRRDISELPMQMAVGFSALILTLAIEWSAIRMTLGIALATGLVMLAVMNALIAAWQCRQLRPYLFHEHDEAVLAEFKEFDPEVLCYFNGHRGSTYAVDVWLRTFEAMGKRVGLIYRHRDVKSVDTDQLPGIVVRQDATVEEVVSPSTRIAFYPANGTLNIHLQRDKRLAHVFIGHGDSDKTGSASPFTRSYNEVWVSGQAAIDRYEAAGVEIPREKFVIVGRPPLSPVVRDLEREITAATVSAEGLEPPLKALMDELAIADGSGGRPPTLLYAPTWEGYFDQSDYSSVDQLGLELVTLLIEAFPELRVIYKPHPMTGKRLHHLVTVSAEIGAMLEDAEMHHPDPREHPDISLYDWFDLSDVLVTDVSSVLSDYIAWDRPCVVTNPRGLSTAALHAQFPTTRAAYVVEPGSSTTKLVIENALTLDPMSEIRPEMRQYFLGDGGEDPLELINCAAERLYQATSQEPK